jgi:hypothetical protein
MKKIITLFFLLIFFSNIQWSFSDIIYNGGEVVLKLSPEKVETNGELVKINITVENIPPKDSLKSNDISNSQDYLPDGGLGGVQVYLNYSPEYLEAVGFNWSDACKDDKLKEYEFKDGKFWLNINFDEPIFDNSFVVGTLIFNPKKNGITHVDFLNVINSTDKNKLDVDDNNRSCLSSKVGRVYDHHGENINIISNGKKISDDFIYPDTLFKGCTVIIKGIGKENITKNLKDEFKETASTGASTIINNVNVIATQKNPKIIVKKLNVSEIEPNVSVVLNVNYDKSMDYKLLGILFIISSICGVIFGFLSNLNRFV